MTDNKPIKRKRVDYMPNTEEGYNSKALLYLMDLKNTAEINTKDPDQVRDRIEWYFNKCIEYDMKPGVESLAVALHVDRTTLYRWAKGQMNTQSGITPAVKDAYQVITAMMENYMMNGKINPVAGIFLMSNNMGYQQKVTHGLVQETPDPLEGKSIEELRKRYADVIDISSTESEEDTENNDF